MEGEPVIIIEGPDGAGKSTLVKELQELFPHLLTGERGVDDRDKLWEVTRQDTYRAICEALTDPNPHIWDRLFWSEFAYWEITGRECQFNARDRQLIPDLVRSIGAPVIFCMPPLDVVKTNVEAEKQMSGVVPNIEKIYGVYQGMIEHLKNTNDIPNLLVYDYTSPLARDDFHRIVGRVEAYLLERRPAS